ncbi:MAG: TIGR04255 family protein [Betaproteobacteria bacterium]|nr:TIGR04255 family protein [Betaproteobacteria bacterium]
MYEQTCYERPFLKEVIVRVDFVVPIQSIAKELPPKIANELSKQFPISEPHKAIAQELQVSDDEVHHARKEVMEWIFFGKEREKRLVITSETFFISYSTYNTYEDMVRDFTLVADELFKAFPDVRSRRLGLRYINNIEVQDKNKHPLMWDDLINPQLLGLFGAFDPATLIRLFHFVEFKHDDVRLKFQFGIPNPDYPALIRKPLFILDFDASVTASQDRGEINSNIERCHALIQERFESSISDRLRELMHAKPQPAA